MVIKMRKYSNLNMGAQTYPLLFLLLLGCKHVFCSCPTPCGFLRLSPFSVCFYLTYFCLFASLFACISVSQCTTVCLCVCTFLSSSMSLSSLSFFFNSLSHPLCVCGGGRVRQRERENVWWGDRE